MTNQTQNTSTFNDLVEKGKELVEKGNRRRVIIRNAGGKQVLEVRVTVAVAAVIIAMFIGFPGWLLLLGVVGLGVLAKLRVEIVRDISAGDDVGELELSEGEDKETAEEDVEAAAENLNSAN